MIYEFKSDDVNDCRQWLLMFGFSIVVSNRTEHWRRPNGEVGIIVPNENPTWRAAYAAVI